MGDRRQDRRWRMLAVACAVLMFGFALPQAVQAVHFYRSEDFGCSAASGDLSDDGSSPEQADAVVSMMHNTFHDRSSGLPVDPIENATGTPVTHVEVGDTVTWVWRSEHCHSVSSRIAPTAADGFESGFHYPAETPDTPQAVEGFLDYPVPELGDTALTFSHTFETPGRYTYVCIHHGSIGMQGVVVVSDGY